MTTILHSCRPPKGAILWAPIDATRLILRQLPRAPSAAVLCGKGEMSQPGMKALCIFDSVIVSVSTENPSLPWGCRYGRLLRFQSTQGITTAPHR